MHDDEMTLTRLRDIVEAYGAAAHRWPASERDAALALIEASDEARALLDDALQLDLMLDAAPAAEPASDMLVSRIMAARPRAVAGIVAQPAATRSSGFWRGLVQDLWPYGTAAVPAGALAASIMLGVTFGLTAPATVSALGFGQNAQTAAASSDVGDQLVSIALADTAYPEEWQ